MTRPGRVVVVGAGLAGLSAARQLAESGADVVVLDKGRSPGGRLATRRIDDGRGGTARLDHGAQFFTVRSEELAAHVTAWERAGVVREWTRGFADVDGHPRYVGTAGMNGIAKHLAAGLDVRCRTLAFAIRPAPGGWSVGLDDGTAVAADAVVVTCPVPQSYALCVSAEVELPEALVRTDYDRTLALLTVLDRPGAVPVPGGVQDADATFSFVGDNQAKGISEVPAVTLHARPEVSEARWDDDPDAVRVELLGEARPWLGAATVVASQLKRWRFATPRTIWPERAWVAGAGDRGPLVLAGDAFGGPKVEGAVRSGLAAARAVVAS